MLLNLKSEILENLYGLESCAGGIFKSTYTTHATDKFSDGHCGVGLPQLFALPRKPPKLATCLVRMVSSRGV